MPLGLLAQSNAANATIDVAYETRVAHPWVVGLLMSLALKVRYDVLVSANEFLFVGVNLRNSHFVILPNF